VEILISEPSGPSLSVAQMALSFYVLILLFYSFFSKWVCCIHAKALVIIEFQWSLHCRSSLCDKMCHGYGTHVHAQTGTVKYANSENNMERFCL
jgi:hypothetical protein